MNATRKLRDVVTLTLGSTLVLSQVIIQWQSRGQIEPNIALITAGVSLLAGYPLLKLGDGRVDKENGEGKGGRP